MKFKKLEPADYKELKCFFGNQNYQICVYSLSSIIAWSNQFYQPYGAIDDDTLFVYADFTNKRDLRHLILPISPEREYAPKDLYQLARDLQFESYWFVPEDYIIRYGKSEIEPFFKIKEQKGYHDFVYLTQDLADLKGNKFSKKRNLIHQFEKEYLNKGRVKIGNITPADVKECIDFLEEWCSDTKCDVIKDEELACEKQAAINTLENLDLLEVNELLLRIDGKVSAFGIATRLTKDMGVLHFEKAFSSIKGLYQFFDNECAKRLFKDYIYINKESDMNISGLSKAKKSYHPVRIIKSFQFILN